MSFLNGIRNLFGNFETQFQSSIFNNNGENKVAGLAVSLLAGMILDEFVSDNNIDDVVEKWIKQQEQAQNQASQQIHSCEHCAKDENQKAEMPKYNYTPVDGRITWITDEKIANLALPEKQDNIKALILHMGNYDSTLQMYDDMSKVTSLSEFSSLGGEVDDVCAKKDMSEEEKQIRDNVKLDALSLAIDNIIAETTQTKESLMKNADYPQALKEDLEPLYAKLADSVDKHQQVQIQAEIAELINESVNNNQERTKFNKINAEISSAIINLNNAESLKSMLVERDSIEDENLKTELNNNILSTFNSYRIESECYQNIIIKAPKEQLIAYLGNDSAKAKDTIKLYDQMEQATSFSEFSYLINREEMTSSKEMSAKEKLLRQEAKLGCLNLATQNIYREGIKTRDTLMEKSDLPETLKNEIYPLYEQLSLAKSAEEQNEVQAEITSTMHKAKKAGLYSEKVRVENYELTSACLKISNATQLQSLLNQQKTTLDSEEKSKLNQEIFQTVNSFSKVEESDRRNILHAIEYLSYEQQDTIGSLIGKLESVKYTEFDENKIIEKEQMLKAEILDYCISEEILYEPSVQTMLKYAEVGVKDGMSFIETKISEFENKKADALDSENFPYKNDDELISLYNELSQAKEEYKADCIIAQIECLINQKSYDTQEEKDVANAKNKEIQYLAISIAHNTVLNEMYLKILAEPDNMKRAKYQAEFSFELSRQREIERHLQSESVILKDNKLSQEQKDVLFEYIKDISDSRDEHQRSEIKTQMSDYLVSQPNIKAETIEELAKILGMQITPQNTEKQMDILSILNGMENEFLNVIDQLETEYNTTGTTDYDVIERMISFFGGKYFEESEVE